MRLLRKADQRGHADHGWLKARHTFSFADYHDPEWMGFRSLRVLNDDTVDPGSGFGRHPHRDMEILTYILSGSLEHQDSMGNRRIIQTGEVQYMAAGTGVFHSEFNPSTSEPVHLLQIWILPQQRGVTPAYADRSPAGAEPGRWHCVASATGREGSIRIHQDADLLLSRLRPGDRVGHSMAAGRHVWVHVAEGRVMIDGQVLESGDGLAVWSESELAVEATLDSQVLLFDLA
ncbi:MAG: pirin family protein [Verrucomicrobia bacterium]|nr:pirin family protein [Verrucomicrobiota bacterium]